ncbi:MAG TPA: DUF4419 domain-containing protein [Chthonomonadaceae bacterium]|nr:DUF4419 domain-containing protein [Chthonomonadaceae bacterium]
MVTTKSSSGITFAVDDVRPAREALPTVRPLEALQKLFDAKESRWDLDDADGRPISGRVEACWSYLVDCVGNIRHHPLIAAAHLAFSEHRPLTLSPDVIWITIAQGFAAHIRQKPEEYRSLLVRHEGKREIQVTRTDFHRGTPENPWESVVAQFAASASREMGELADALICDFSTTGPAERTASQVVLLDILEPYYKYRLLCICGIPSITLLGTANDWRRLRAKVEHLAPFGVDWWLKDLRPICDQFVLAADGSVDLAHWQRIYKLRKLYGRELVNGWLGQLFPYVHRGQRNQLLDPAVQAQILELEAAEKSGNAEPFQTTGPGVSTYAFPRGISQVEFTQRFTDAAETRAMEMLAGPMAVVQDSETLALQPVVGWAIREAPPIEQAVSRLASHTVKLLDDESRRAAQEAARDLEIDLPADADRFYDAAESAVIRSDAGSETYQILPVPSWRQITDPQLLESVARPTGDDDPVNLWRFAKMADSTEMLILLESPDESGQGAVYVGSRPDGSAAPDTGRKIAQSFTDFLLRALDCPDEPYFRRPGFSME